MTHRARAGLLAGLTITLVLAGVVPARAHAVLSVASPAIAQRLEAAPDEVRITFTEPPDLAGSSIAVLSSAGASVGRGPVKIRPGAANDLVVRLGPLADGVYTVTWRVLSRIDGHVTGGAYAFGVRADPTAVSVTPQANAQPVPPLGVASRWLMYMGTFLLIGVGVLGLLAREQNPPRAMAGAGVVLTLLGIAGLALAQRSDAGLAWGDLLGSSIGASTLRRALPLVVAVVVARAIKARRPRAVALAAGAIGVIAAHSFYGHAGAFSPAAPVVIIQSLHVTAAAAWIGGLIAVLGVFRRLEGADRTSLVRRYSRLALVLFIVVAGLGSLRAIGEVGSFGALTSTGFGRIVLFKIAAILTLGAMGAINRYRSIPRLGERPETLRAVGRAEVILAAVVLLATGLMTSLAPPRTTPVADASTQAPRATATDFGRTVTVRLVASPGGTGPNRYDVRLTDPASGDTRDADSVSLRFRYGGPSLIEPATLLLARAGVGRFTASSSAMALPGPWHITATVTTGTSVAEVAMIVATTAEQTTRTIPQPGAPTITDITLAGGTVQMYVTPGNAGQNEVHATFFDAAAGEDDSLRDVALVASNGRDAIESLTVRTLSPGHFVANGTLEAGRWRFDVFATRGTEPVWAYIYGAINK